MYSTGTSGYLLPQCLHRTALSAATDRGSIETGQALVA
jgi:hypothetical protein